MQTPWGMADYVERLSDAVAFCGTPSHGGFYVSNTVIDRIPKPWREYAKRSSGSEQWFEEDCAAIAVVISFPELFSTSQVEAAQSMAKQCLPKLEPQAA